MLQKLCVPVLNNFENLYNSKKNYDVIIQAGEENKEIYAHSVVLCYLSIEKGSDILKLLVATEELGLNILNEFIQEFLIENQNEYLQNDPLGVLELVSQHETFTNLKDSLLEIICHEPKILFGTDKILSLPAQILESLLKREDLALDEIEIWDNLTKWAHAQQPTVDKNPFEWTKNELALMERTLLKLIPLIRFHDITSKAYYEKVIPYEDLFPKKLRLEIMKFYLTSDIKQIGLLQSRSFFGTIDSVIINTIYSIIYRDGNTAASFHAKCNDKGATIVVAKIKGSNKVVGGYNPLDWNGNGDKSTPDSFIFIFEDYNNICTGRIGRVMRKSHAVRCLIDYGPLFGSYNRGSNDIMVTRDGKWSSVTNSYPNINIPRNFVIDDYEVFQVIKK
ncbi:unnamed protein product [Rhizophagus irregularis]|nr:unnamed protein product [Rhizophagus irregularis]